MSKNRQYHWAIKRGYIQLSKAWYGTTCLKDSKAVDEVQIGVYGRSSEGGCLAEFTIRWYELSNKKISPKLEVFDDAWEVFFKYFGDLFEQMALISGKDYTPEDFCKILDSLKIENCTPKNPI